VHVLLVVYGLSTKAVDNYVDEHGKATPLARDGRLGDALGKK